MGQLYTVVVEVELQAWAEDEDEAENIGLRHVRDELANAVVCANPTLKVPREWENAIPYGTKDDKTCAMLMAKGE